MRKVLPYLLQGLALCLGGFAFFYLQRKLSSLSSEESSDRFETTLSELKAWKKQVDLDLDSQYDRVRSVMGRLDRAKRKDSTSQDPPGNDDGGSNDQDDQGKLNAMLARKFYGV